MPRYLTGLQALVVNPSYTRDSTGVKREATLMEEIFRQSSLLSITAERSDGRDAEYGQHLVLRVGLRGSADRGVAGRRKVGLVSHLDTVYPEATLLRDDHKYPLYPLFCVALN
jgi:acetylornithine deacetylase/succinyl-diaminopimelate desuccinylase-like protein